MTFVKDPDGRVVKAIHRQGDIVVDAPRWQPARLTSAELNAILGQYDYHHGSILTITREGDQVYAQLTGQERFAIYPKSPTEFYWQVADASVNFIENANRKVSKAMHHQNGTIVNARKIK